MVNYSTTAHCTAQRLSFIYGANMRVHLGNVAECLQAASAGCLWLCVALGRVLFLISHSWPGFFCHAWYWKSLIIAGRRTKRINIPGSPTLRRCPSPSRFSSVWSPHSTYVSYFLPQCSSLLHSTASSTHFFLICFVCLNLCRVWPNCLCQTVGF